MKQAKERAEELVEQFLQNKAWRFDRYIIGITGVPGAGKSTLSEAVKREFEIREFNTQVVPMDGFHLTNAQLRQNNLVDRKGAPQSFDIKGFLSCLEELHTVNKKSVYCPLYSRETHEPVAGAIVVKPETHLIIVEGNYLLLDWNLWSEVRNYLDEVWFVDIPIDIALERVRLRHRKKGLNEEEIEKKITINDLPNALLVKELMHKADKQVKGFPAVW